MHGFIVAVEKEANEKTGELDGMYKLMDTAINDALENIPEKYKKRLKYDTPKRLAYLNDLNQLLKEKEKQIVEGATEYLSYIKQKIDNKDSFTKDYELEVEVQYYLKNGGDPVHVYWTNFRYERVEEEIFGLLCDGEDWRESYMPILNEPYCYLLHDLIDHSRLGNKLFSISNIWIDIHLHRRKYYSMQLVML